MDRWYDTNGDGRGDYRERLSGQGHIVALGYDTNGDGNIDDDVLIDKIPETERRDLVMILDSIPFEMVRQLWDQGRFRLFSRPSRTIAPFPVMTDLSLSEFFGVTPCPGVEAAYYDGNILTNGVDVYLCAGNVPWKAYVDYRLKHLAHPYAYLWPHGWYGHELKRIQDLFLNSNKQRIIGYVVSTSALGARVGRSGHQAGLVCVDRFCQQIMYETRGRARITLLSDHGHHLAECRRIPLPQVLQRLGYRLCRKLEKPGDVVVPEFGMVTCASVYTQRPAEVARDVVGIEGVDLTAYCDKDDTVIVHSRDGRARISQSVAGLRYQPDYGDPLELMPIIDRLEKQGQVGKDGFIDDRLLFEATITAVYPDAVHRLWRAFHGLIKYTPDVLISLKNGYFCGHPNMSKLVTLVGAHGNLTQSSSSGFAMTTAGEVPAVLRMENLRAALQQLGVSLND